VDEQIVTRELPIQLGGAALDRQIDLMWALIASLQTIQSECAPVLADAILDGLSAIRRDMDRL
jgi:hypothetical protein